MARPHGSPNTKTIKGIIRQPRIISQSGFGSGGLYKINSPMLRGPANISSKNQLAYYAAQQQAPVIR